MKTKKWILIILVAIFTIASLSVLFVQQSKHGIYLNGFSYLMRDVEQLELDDYIENCSDIDDDTFLYLRNENRFPSKNAKDYREIVLYADFKNRSLLEYTLYDSYISDVTEDSIVCFAITNTSGDTIGSMTNEKYVPVITLFVYVGDSELTKIENNLDNLVIDTYFYNKLFKNNKYTYSLADEKIEQLSKNPYE